MRVCSLAWGYPSETLPAMSVPSSTLDTLAQRLTQQPDDRRALAHRGACYLTLGRYGEALADLDRAITLDPDYSWAWARRGEAHRLLENLDAALNDLDKALALRPDYVWALAHRGVTHEEQRDFPRALADLNRAIALEPTYAWAIAHRGRTYEQMRRYAEALVDFDHALALDPTIIPDCHTERALLLTFMERYDEALEGYHRGLHEWPDDLLARYGIVVVAVQQQGVEALGEAFRDLRAILTAVPDGPSVGVALYGLAGLDAMEGRSDEALARLPQAIRAQRIRLETARHDPAWKRLHHDPRFQGIIQETGPAVNDRIVLPPLDEESVPL